MKNKSLRCAALLVAAISLAGCGKASNDGTNVSEPVSEPVSESASEATNSSEETTAAAEKDWINEIYYWENGYITSDSRDQAIYSESESQWDGRFHVRDLVFYPGMTMGDIMDQGCTIVLKCTSNNKGSAWYHADGTPYSDAYLVVDNTTGFQLTDDDVLYGLGNFAVEDASSEDIVLGDTIALHANALDDTKADLEGYFSIVANDEREILGGMSLQCPLSFFFNVTSEDTGTPLRDIKLSGITDRVYLPEQINSSATPMTAVADFFGNALVVNKEDPVDSFPCYPIRYGEQVGLVSMDTYTTVEYVCLYTDLDTMKPRAEMREIFEQN